MVNEYSACCKLLRVCKLVQSTRIVGTFQLCYTVRAYSLRSNYQYLPPGCILTQLQAEEHRIFGGLYLLCDVEAHGPGVVRHLILYFVYKR